MTNLLESVMSVRIPYHASISADGFAFRSQMSLSSHALVLSASNSTALSLLYSVFGIFCCIQLVVDARIYRVRGILYLSALDSLEQRSDKKGLIHSSHIWGYTMLWSVIAGDNAGLIVWKD